MTFSKDYYPLVKSLSFALIPLLLYPPPPTPNCRFSGTTLNLVMIDILIMAT